MSAIRHVILGGSGFIGRHVALGLLQRGATVVVADRNPPHLPPCATPGRLSHARIELGTADLPALLRDGDVVHHYAWSTIPKTAEDDPLADLDGNVRATLRLLDALSRLRGARLLFASSGGTVYGRLRGAAVGEGHALEPTTAYGVSKVAVEKYVGFYRASRGLDARIARISNPYGVGQNPARKQGAASVFLHRALTGQPIEVWGDGSVVRDYIHVADLVEGLIALAEAAPEPAETTPVFNLGSGEGTSIDHLLGVLGRLLGEPQRPNYLPSRAFDIPVNVLDISRAAGQLGWRPELDLAAGLARAIADHRAGALAYSTLHAQPRQRRRAAA